MSIRILEGDCRTVLAGLPDGSVNCCVTSPPYFGLRDYGVDGQMGLEATPAEFVAGMVEVFREVRRVLRDDGTLWLNLGDSYAGNGKTTPQDLAARQDEYGNGRRHTRWDASVRAPTPVGLKPKDLIGIPWRVAFALQTDGWYLRQDIIWSKPNPMPESVTDRCTKAHEYLFLLSKRAQYYYSFEEIKEPGSENVPWSESSGAGSKDAALHLRGATSSLGKAARKRGLPPRHAQYPESSDQSGLDGVGRGMGRNKRSVWTVASQPFKEAHFATFPPDLIEPCILAGCPVGGTVLDPFGGAGTTGLVADRLQRDAVLIELNPGYVEMARKRIAADAGMFNSVAAR